MTQNFQHSRKVIVASGFTNPLTHDIKLESSAHLKVYADDTLLQLGVDYTLDDVGELDGYDVNITIPDPGLEPAWWGNELFILSVEPPIDQGDDISLGGTFGLQFEEAIDKLSRRLMHVYDMALRSIKSSRTLDPATLDQDDLVVDPAFVQNLEASVETAVESAAAAAQSETNADNAQTAAEAARDAAVAAAATINGPMTLQGVWDASAGTFPVATTKGWTYIVSVAGTVDGQAFEVNDKLVALVNNPSTAVYAANWYRLETDLVQSVAGKTGVVTLQVADITDMSANARSLNQAANYAAMRALLDLEAGTDFLSPAAIAAAYATKTATINVKDFGAVGNGSTDDRAAIQAAIDFAEALSGGMSVIDLGGAQYALAAGLVVNDGSYIVIQNGELKAISGTWTGSDYAVHLDDGIGHSLQNVRIDCAHLTGGVKYTTSRCLLSNVDVVHPVDTSYGVDFDSGSNNTAFRTYVHQWLDGETEQTDQAERTATAFRLASADCRMIECVGAWCELPLRVVNGSHHNRVIGCHFYNGRGVDGTPHTDPINVVYEDGAYATVFDSNYLDNGYVDLYSTRAVFSNNIYLYNSARATLTSQVRLFASQASDLLDAEFRYTANIHSTSIDPFSLENNGFSWSVNDDIETDNDNIDIIGERLSILQGGDEAQVLALLGSLANRATVSFKGKNTTTVVDVGCNGSSFSVRTNNLDSMNIANDGSVQFQRIATTASAANAFLDSGASNSLFRSTSSGRYKKDVEPLDPKLADAILGLRPVWYRSLAPADNPDWSWYGLIAEEVAEVDPRLVHWGYADEDYDTVVVDKKGNKEQVLKADAVKKPDGVQYERLAVLLLDIVKRQDARISALETRQSK